MECVWLLLSLKVCEAVPSMPTQDYPLASSPAARPPWPHAAALCLTSQHQVYR